MKFLIPALLLAVAVGCDPGAGDRPSVSPGQNAPIPVQVSHPVEREITDYEEFKGHTGASETVDIRSRVSGYLEKINFEDGKEVTKGQVLFEIDPRPYQADLDKANSDVNLAQARSKRAEADYQRALVLSRTPGAISQQEIDKYFADRAEADAALKANQAAVERLKLYREWTAVKAPIAGKIGRRLVDIGNLVTQDTTLLTTIVNEDPMYAYFDVGEQTQLRVQKQIREGKIKSASETEVPVELGLGDSMDFPFKGTLNFVNNQVDASTGTLRLRATFKNPSTNNVRSLTSGQSCRVRVQVGAPYKALVVAERAILREQTRSYVLIVDDKNQVLQKSVTPGTPFGGGLRAIVTDPDPNARLLATDRVIVEGTMRVRPGTEKTPGSIVAPELVPMPGTEKK